MLNLAQRGTRRPHWLQPYRALAARSACQPGGPTEIPGVSVADRLLPWLIHVNYTTLLAVQRRTLQGMARFRSGQAAAWPLATGRRRHRGSAVNGGRRPFLKETRSAIDGEGGRRTLSGPSSDLSPAALIRSA
jgi:hypothetical protein